MPGGLNMSALRFSSLALASAMLVASLSAQPAAPHAEERVTRTAAGHVREHAPDELRDPASFATVRRDAREVVTKPRAAPGNKGFTDGLKVAYGDSWIYEAMVDLFTDHDGDGYYRFLRVQFDADTIYTRTWVYAEIYLSADGTAWEHLYSTRDFSIEGTAPDDDYEVETELVSGYSTGRYDVLIELYDADTGELVDEYGPNESPELSLLPLEDAGRDGAVVVPEPMVIDDGGGGAISWLVVAGLLGALALRPRARPPSWRSLDRPT
jgi:hypothetical protein